MMRFLGNMFLPKKKLGRRSASQQITWFSPLVQLFKLCSLLDYGCPIKKCLYHPAAGGRHTDTLSSDVLSAAAAAPKCHHPCTCVCCCVVVRSTAPARGAALPCLRCMCVCVWHLCNTVFGALDAHECGIKMSALPPLPPPPMLPRVLDRCRWSASHAPQAMRRH